MKPNLILAALATSSPSAPQGYRRLSKAEFDELVSDENRWKLYEREHQREYFIVDRNDSLPPVTPAVPDHAGLLDRIDVLEHALRSIVEFDSVDIAVTNTAIRALRPGAGDPTP